FNPPGNGGAGLQNRPSIDTPQAYSFAVGETHVFSPTIVNDLRVGFTNNESDQNIPATASLYAEFGIRGVPQVVGLTGLPQIGMTGYTGLGDRAFAPNPKHVQVLQLNDNLSITRGNHTIRTGGDLRFTKNFAASSNNARGNFTFNGQFTSRVPGQGRGDAIADLLLGQTSNAQLTTLLTGDFRDQYYGFYVNDNWKVTPRLTLNLGLRYEIQTPLVESDNRLANFDIDRTSPTFGTLVSASGDSLRSRGFVELDKNNLAPRVGFAYQVDPKTVLRGSFGIFYGGLGYQGIAQTGAANVPFFINVAFPSPTTAAASNLVLANGFPVDALDLRRAVNPAAFAYVTDNPLSEVYQGSVGVQREVIGNTVLSVAYVGSGSAHLTGLNDVNAPVPGPGAVQPRRLFPNFGGITVKSSFVHSTYHSLQAKAERRFSRGFSLLSSYTWSHSIDNSVDPEDTGNGPTQPQNPNNTAAEKASSAIDIRHRLVTSLIFDLPIGRAGGFLGESRIVRAMLGGFQIGGIFVAQSGPSFSPSVAPNPANTTTPARPDRRGDGSLPGDQRSIERWFDVAAFAPAAPFTFGNSGRNILRAPGLVNLDLLVARNFRFTESKRLELRGEFFNFTNTAHFGIPSAVINSPQAGQITNTSVPNRQIQLGLRFVF
ncbi:MAG: TonB-dependent receptor, partial [Acidobacteriota bacterium]|nr:TonB-dependent receptor [Acidobacteriota bacterium]